MKPTFALDLTREAVALLHRTPKGWLSIGEVAFDAPDLAEGLDYLRKTALGLSPMGMACKLILPNSQILYTEVHAPGPSREDKRRQIAAALEGRTPYAVEDLVFDWSGKGQTVKVAVVARETLQEAEGFANTHRLNPVSFVAIPAPGDFVGEPWFGPSATAEASLAPGESVDRDREPVVVLHRDPPPDASVAAVDPADGDEAADDAVGGALADPAPTEAASAALPADDDDPLPGLEEALNADLPLPLLQDSTVRSADDFGTPGSVEADDSDLDLDHDALAVALADTTTTLFDAQALATPAAAAGAEAFDPAPEGPDQADGGHEDRPAANAEPLELDLPGSAALAAALSDPNFPAAPDPRLADLAPPAAEDPLAADDVLQAPPGPLAAMPEPAVPAPAEVDEAPFAHVTDTAAFPDDPGVAPVRQPSPQLAAPAAPMLAADPDDDLPPAPSPAAMVAFASRRALAGAPAAGRLAEGAARVPPAAAVDAPIAAAAAASPATGGGRAAPVPRPSSTRAFQGLVTAPTIPGPRTRPKGKVGLTDPGLAAAAAAATGPMTVKSPARPGGTFGNAAPPRNRSGVVFMVLVGLLLLFLAVLAAWSSYFLSQNGAAETDGARLAEPIAVTPGVEDEMLADMQDPEGMTAPLPEAEGPALAAGDAGALATESLAPEDAATVPAEPVDLAAPADAGAAEAAGSDAPVPDLATAEAESGTTTPASAAPATEPAPETVVATDVTAAQAPAEDQDEIFLSAMDAPPPALDALALPAPAAVEDTTPPPPLPPPAFGTVYQFDDKGLLVPTPEGILSPDGIMLFAGPPPLVPPARSETAAAAARAAAALLPAPSGEPVADAAADATASAVDASLAAAGIEAEAAPDTAAPADPSLSGFRPRPRPAGLVPAPEDDAALTGPADSDIAGVRPLPRPQIVLAAAAAARPADLGAQGASLTAQAEAERAAAAALEAENPSIVAISRRPEPRPADLSRAVEAAVAAAVRDPEPEVVAAAASPEDVEALDEEAVADAGPSIPTNANVAKQATFANAINLSNMNLIGTYGTESRRTALIRQSNGRYKKVEVGDKIDGGTVMAITETEVRYQKGGKLLVLAMPKA